MLMYIMSSCMQYSYYLKAKWIVFRTKRNIKRLERRIYDEVSDSRYYPIHFQALLDKYKLLVDQLDYYNSILQ